MGVQLPLPAPDTGRVKLLIINGLKQSPYPVQGEAPAPEPNFQVQKWVQRAIDVF